VEEETDLLVAGGGPAGMMAGLLFARAGVRTLVVEKHDDFLRDFRGDTVHRRPFKSSTNWACSTNCLRGRTTRRGN
jgi:2-polyprenyl-6-methoxyphenol hydroxylase-like FAD-dependent oxidoreductase